MKYFKDLNNSVFAYEEDGSQDEFISPSLIAITEEEAESLRVPKFTAEQMWNEIKAARDRRSESGCKVDEQWFHNDIKSRTQWERTANRASTLEDSDPYLVDEVQVAWKTMTGAFVLLTAGLIRQVVDAFEVHEVATFKAAEIHRAAMEAVVDPSAYDYSDGWPEIFAG